MKNVLYIPVFCILFFVGPNTKIKSQQTSDIKPFKSGENLKYIMSYGWIKGGEAKLKMEKRLYNGKQVYYVKAVGKTIGVAHSIYHVIDIYESWFDVNSGLPYKSIMDLTEAKYKNYNVVHYNQAKKTLVSKKSGKKRLKHKVFDIISAFYHMRQSLNNLKIGQKVTIHTYFHDDPWDLVVRYKGNETIKTEVGKINCMKFKPVVEKGTFKDENALDIWISNDKNRVPVRAKMKFFVGSFKTDLVEYSGLVYPLKIQK
ncbi:MAG: hypothetical protein B6I20_14365 [Bacteroidetes bacterium 4572_117]|nr:MAG: hypothetical protein B6I20_14365 [Bacteroidetes bacterium 4572_117]